VFCDKAKKQKKNWEDIVRLQKLQRRECFSFSRRQIKVGGSKPKCDSYGSKICFNTRTSVDIKGKSSIAVIYIKLCHHHHPNLVSYQGTDHHVLPIRSK